MDIWLTHETKRREAYRLLSACYFSPDLDALDKLRELREIFADVCPPADKAILARAAEGSLLEELEIDHARLFVGPFDLLAPPYGSVYLDGKGRRIIGDSTIDVERRYAEAGLGTGGGFKEAPDHIAIELEFLYYLVFKEVEAAASSDMRTAQALLAMQQAFLSDHLGAWIDPFTEAVIKNATTGYYRGLAGATRAFVSHDLGSIATASMAELKALA